MQLDYRIGQWARYAEISEQWPEGANPDAFFTEHVKDFGLPKFKGTLVSMKPAIRPKQLLIAVEKPSVADCTLNLDEGQVLAGKMEPGAEIEFEGTGTAYTKEPYMLTLTVDKTKISGWKPVAAPPVPKKAGVKKRAE